MAELRQRRNELEDAARRRRRGFTLAEALLATTVLAIVAASAALPFAAGIHQANEAAELQEAVALGQAMMEEVLARPFFEASERIASPGPGPGEGSRELFNNIDDFDGYTESDGVLRDFLNEPITDASLSGFRREVAVQYVTLSGLGQQANDVNSFVHIQVRVYYGSALLVTLDRLASRED